MPVPSGKYGRSEYGALPVTVAYSLSCCCTLYLTHPGELVTPGKLSEAAAKWSSRLPWVPVRHGQRQVAVVASQVEHVSITVVSGRVSSGNGSLTCRSLALWPMPRACGTTPSWCPRR